MRAATAAEEMPPVRPKRGVPTEASLGVIDSARMADAALHQRWDPSAHLPSRLMCISLKLSQHLSDVIQSAVSALRKGGALQAGQARLMKPLRWKQIYHLSMDAAGVEVPEEMSFAICSEFPHNSLACMSTQTSTLLHSSLKGLTRQKMCIPENSGLSTIYDKARAAKGPAPTVSSPLPVHPLRCSLRPCKPRKSCAPACARGVAGAYSVLSNSRLTRWFPVG